MGERAFMALWKAAMNIFFEIAYEYTYIHKPIYSKK